MIKQKLIFISFKSNIRPYSSINWIPNFSIVTGFVYSLGVDTILNILAISKLNEKVVSGIRAKIFLCKNNRIERIVKMACALII